MGAIAVVFGYLACTIPCVGILVGLLRLRSDQATHFTVALWLQLVPVGLLFWPLGLPGVILLGLALWRCLVRNRKLRASGIVQSTVERLWHRETIGAFLALGFACEQKAMAWLFMDVTGHRGWAVLGEILIPASVVTWTAIALGIWRERHRFHLRHPVAAEPAS